MTMSHESQIIVYAGRNKGEVTTFDCPYLQIFKPTSTSFDPEHVTVNSIFIFARPRLNPTLSTIYSVHIWYPSRGRTWLRSVNLHL